MMNDLYNGLDDLYDEFDKADLKAKEALERIKAADLADEYKAIRNYRRISIDVIINQEWAIKKYKALEIDPEFDKAEREAKPALKRLKPDDYKAIRHFVAIYRAGRARTRRG